MHLYIDTYLTESPIRSEDVHIKSRTRELDLLRSRGYPYQKKPKVDIFRFTLLSYRHIKWETIVINYEIEHASTNDYDGLNAFIRSIFPNAHICNSRSDTAVKFLKNLERFPEDDWIFFSTHNDHVFWSNHEVNFQKYFLKADQYKDRLCSISYSHYPESSLMLRYGDRLFGYNYLNHRVIYEDESQIHIKYRQQVLDSTHIYRGYDLVDRFAADKTGRRVVRPEDLASYLAPGDHIVIFPKEEICYHYDGYTHFEKNVLHPLKFGECPPLFIPDGLEEDSIRIEFTKDSRSDEGVITSCGAAEFYSFQQTNNDSSDLKFCFDELPLILKGSAASIIRKCNDCPRVVSLENKKSLALSSYRYVRNYFYFMYRNTKRKLQTWKRRR